MSGQAAPVRVFLDTGVIIEGCSQSWGASKVVLILMTQRRHYTVVLAEDVEKEISRVLARLSSRLTERDARDLLGDVRGWLHRIRIERCAAPSPSDIERFSPILLPVLRHVNDLGPVITAINAQPDWVISANRDHWNDDLAARAGLRIVTPHAYMTRLLHPE